MGKLEQEEKRKGPWTEEEDAQLVFYVNLFGDRRWDFVAKVSGLKRTGKSCRLRWVNYLHPGLKRSKMTPLEERLVLDLHSKWGNRWSRIARKIPGRTDNEIKNYWRTHMRKKAQENKKKKCCNNNNSNSNSSNDNILQLPSSSTSSSSSIVTAPEGRSFYDTGGINDFVNKSKTTATVAEDGNKVYSMDEIWKDIELIEESSNLITNQLPTLTSITSPLWDFAPNDSLWSMDEEESKIHHFNSFPF